MKRLKLFIAGIMVLVQAKAQQPVYEDVPFWQDKSEYVFASQDQTTDMQKVLIDRNNVVQILTPTGLVKPNKITIVKQHLYRPLVDMNILDMKLYRDEYMYLTDKAVLSNAWAGTVYVPYDLKGAKTFDGGADFDFLVGSDAALVYVDKNGENGKVKLPKKSSLVDIKYDKDNNGFWILTNNKLGFYDVKTGKLESKLDGSGFTAFTLMKNHSELTIATTKGYKVFDKGLNKVTKNNEKLPCVQLTSVNEIDGRLWFGSKDGAFMLKDDGKFNYYASRRWLPDNEVRYVSKGKGNSVLVLTSKGLAVIKFELMTLYDKAVLFEDQVRERHNRNGFNAKYKMDIPGDLSSGTMTDSDNDGLWTSMYLAGEVFRYAVTKSPDAMENIRQSFDAMERLHYINPVKGFPSRSFERSGYKVNDRDRWHAKGDGLWDWKGTTSSDEAIGHYFVFALIAELVDDADMKARAIKLIDEMTQHLVDHDFYFVDVDGNPTKWGRWNPDYVNHFPVNVGDRKLNSSNIIAFLQTGYHFTGKEIYKKKAYELMEKYGYLENTLRSMDEIGRVTDGDEHAKNLSESWNHSDDEMYFLSYWYLYPYAFNNDLKQKFKDAIKDHWLKEKPEKDALWNFCYAMTGADEFDLEGAAWWMREFPLDLIDWTIKNSQRKDIELLPENFRHQRTKEVLPPDERPMYKHNTNMFKIDGGSNGSREYSAGDIYLLPYWMGRYLGVISAPAE